MFIHFLWLSLDISTLHKFIEWLQFLPESPKSWAKTTQEMFDQAGEASVSIQLITFMINIFDTFMIKYQS